MQRPRWVRIKRLVVLIGTKAVGFAVDTGPSGEKQETLTKLDTEVVCQIKQNIAGWETSAFMSRFCIHPFCLDWFGLVCGNVQTLFSPGGCWQVSPSRLNAAWNLAIKNGDLERELFLRHVGYPVSLVHCVSVIPLKMVNRFHLLQWHGIKCQAYSPSLRRVWKKSFRRYPRQKLGKLSSLSPQLIWSIWEFITVLAANR